MMAGTGDYQKVEQGLRRKLAEPLLLSVWQNRNETKPPLPASVQRQVGLRLAQARNGTSDLHRAWELLQQLQADRTLFPCEKGISGDIAITYSCAELKRLTGTVAYHLHSFPIGRLGSSRIVCRGFDSNPVSRSAELRPCLEIALEHLGQSKEILARMAVGMFCLG